MVSDTGKGQKSRAETDRPDEQTTKDRTAPRSAANAISIYLSQIRKMRLLTAEEEKSLARFAQSGDHSARSKLIESNLRLVVNLSRRYANRGLPLLDLIEEGNLGLIRAVEKFDAERGCRFSTYATWWIRQSLERALVNQANTVRLPVHISEDVDRLLKLAENLRREEGREPPVEQLADEMGRKPEYVRRLMGLMRKSFSLDKPLGEDGDFSLHDTMEDEDTPDQAELMLEADRVDLLHGWISQLGEREQEVLRLRYGLYEGEPLTLEQIGKQFGVTRERIRQIEMGALKKLRILTAKQHVDFSWLF